MWKPNFQKFLQIFIREYNIPRKTALLDYSWKDIQDYVSSLPIERVITVYQHKDAKNKERYLEALCDKDVNSALSSLDAAEEEFNRRKLAKKSGG